MATAEHCLYCFEALSASLEKRTPMTLDQVQSSWADYAKRLELSAESTEGNEDEDEDDPTETSKPRPAARNPTLQRLAANRSNDSGTSTPASTSSTSSSSLNPSTGVSTPASSTISINSNRQSKRSNISESPLFVTWNTVSKTSGSRSLRGCIGTFESLPLSTGLSSYALTSALSDHRFAPISLSEVPSLEACVTLLTDFEPAKDAMDWELGVHGIRISFYARNKRYGACYLPDVAPEQGWDKEETVVSLMRKAGWGGRKEKWNEVADLKVVRFQGMMESLVWEEYKGWRDWVKAGAKEAKK